MKITNSSKHGNLMKGNSPLAKIIKENVTSSELRVLRSTTSQARKSAHFAIS